MPLRYTLFSVLLSSLSVQAQNVIVRQGFEGTGGCPDWSYTGGTVNTAMARTGTSSARVGAQGESTTISFAPVTLTGYANVQLSLYHAVRAASGPGMDTGEGAMVQVRLNGSPTWVTVASVGGFGDCAWSWSSPTGGCGGACGTTSVNPAVYNIPNGSTSIEVQVCSNLCPGGIGSYDRPDEGFYIDDIQLTTTSAVVTPSTGSVTWVGTWSTDWFDCRNWNPNVLPGPGWNVTIDQTAVNNCVISSSPTAYCATLQLLSTGPSRKLTITNGRSLKVGGLSTVQRAGTGLDSLVLWLDNGTFETGSLTVGGPNAVFRDNVFANTAQVKGDLLLSTNGKINIANGVLGVAGNLTNNATAAQFIRTNGEVLINGSIHQNIYANGFTDAYTTLRIVKEAEDVTLQTPITVSGTLDLYLGRLFTDATNLISLKASAQVIDASNGSFVHGPIRKEGNSTFIFPLGKGTRYRPLSIAGTAAGTGTFGTNLPTNHFTAQYFNTSARTSVGTVLDATLDHVSDCEYWVLDRTGTLPTTPYVRLSWDDASCGVSMLSDLRVAHWTGAMWSNQGNGGTSGNTLAGWVATSAAQTSFSPWTLASLSANNPLPIQLFSFTAAAQKDRVRLDWTTLTEEENDHFTIERSGDGSDFQPIAQIPGAGNSSTQLNYVDFDLAPLPDLSYYRLRQTDINGATTLSRTVPVNFSTRAEELLTLIPSGNDLLVQHRLGIGTYHVLDASGRICAQGIATAGSFPITLAALPPGIYVLRVLSATQSASERFLH